MLFNSAEYIYFFFTVVVLYYTITSQALRRLLLLAASIYFYMFFIPKYILILAAVIIIDYFSARLIEKHLNAKPSKLFLVLSIVSNVSILFFFKYYNFAMENVNLISGVNLPYSDIVLPIGLSFHTFQSLSYTIEVYRGKFRAEKNFLIFSLYVLYFPQLVAGPIERPQNVIPQLHVRQTFDLQQFLSGLRTATMGYILKSVLADRLALCVTAVYEHSHSVSALDTFTGVVAFSFQIFFDFAGYSLIAIGCSRCLGIELMQNFRNPYLSAGLREFWSRWHISLSTWFRDYVYLPLGGSKVGTAKLFRNIMIVFALSGLWHGASWNFVIWGITHGLLVYLSHVLPFSFRRIHAKLEFIDTAITFLIVSLLWVFFRSPNFDTAISVFRNLGRFFSDPGSLTVLSANGLSTISLLIITLAGLIILVNNWLEKFLQNNKLANVLLISANCSFVFTLGVFQKQTFIYFQF